MPDDPAQLSKVQTALLDAAARRVRSDGRLVYSVCTFTPVETHERVEEFLRDHPAFTRGPTPLRYERWRLDSGDLRFPPGARDGFFMANLERRAV